MRIEDLTIEQQEQMVDMSARYKMYLHGYAYIPLQDLPKFENAFKIVYATF